MFLDLRKFRIVPAIDAGHDIKGYRSGIDHHLDSIRRPFEAVFPPPEPVVVLLKAVQAYCHRMEP